MCKTCSEDSLRFNGYCYNKDRIDSTQFNNIGQIEKGIINNTESNLLIYCTEYDQNCNSCSFNDAKNCKSCNTSNSFLVYYKDGRTRCHTINYMPFGFGKKQVQVERRRILDVIRKSKHRRNNRKLETVSTQIHECEVDNCGLCYEDNSVCTECFSGYVLEGGQCISADGNLSTYTVEQDLDYRKENEFKLDLKFYTNINSLIRIRTLDPAFFECVLSADKTRAESCTVQVDSQSNVSLIVKFAKEIKFEPGIDYKLLLAAIVVENSIADNFEKPVGIPNSSTSYLAGYNFYYTAPGSDGGGGIETETEGETPIWPFDSPPPEGWGGGRILAGESYPGYLVSSSVPTGKIFTDFHFNIKYQIKNKIQEATVRVIPPNVKAINQAATTGEVAGAFLEYGGLVSEITAVAMAICEFSFLPFLSFAQILKLYERMRFVNIKEGDTLTAFLDKIGQILGANEHQNAREFWLDSSKFTGKLSEYRIKMFLNNIFLVKLILFYIIWVAN